MPNNRFQNAVFLQSGLPQTENRAADQYPGQLGASFVIAPEPGGDPNNNQGQGWKVVKNDSVMDVLPTRGATAYWLDRAKNLVTTDVSLAGRGNVAGAYQGPSSLGNICCIQTDGLAQLQLQSGPTASPTTAGLTVIPSATDAKADVLAAGTAATYPILGHSAGAVDAMEADLFPAILSVNSGKV